MNPYVKTLYANDSTPAISAENLNKSEQGIFDATQTTIKNENDLSETNEYLKSQNYDSRLLANSDFIDGFYTSSNRTDGNYGYYRTSTLVPIQDLRVVIDGTIPSNSLYTIQTYDSNKDYLRQRLFNTPITSSDFVILANNITAQYDDIAYVRVQVVIYNSSNNTFARFNNSLNVLSTTAKNVSQIVTDLGNNVDSLSQQVGLLSPQFVVDFANCTLFADGSYIKADGTLGSASAHGVVSFKIATGKFDLIFDVPQDTGVILGVIKNSLGTVVESLAKPSYYGENCRSLNLPDGTYTIYLNWFNKNTTNNYYDEVEVKTYLVSNNIIDSPVLIKRNSYFHNTNKPFAFNGKTAVFIGDSITRGATSSSTVIDSIYPTLFCNKVGMTFTNVAVSGAGFTKSDSAYKILTQLQNAPKTTDYVFIAAGVNDYLDSADLDTFKTAVETAIQYTLENFEGEIIFITPINTAKVSTDHYGFKTELCDYSNAITEVLMENNINMRISIVQGWRFGFPTENSDADYISAMFGDELHPSELGYKALYLSGLLNALC